jgi:hypothetical protein
MSHFSELPWWPSCNSRISIHQLRSMSDRTVRLNFANETLASFCRKMPGLSGNKPTCADRLGTNWQKMSASTSSGQAIFSAELEAQDRLVVQDAPRRGSFDLLGGDGCGLVIKRFLVCATIAW